MKFRCVCQHTSRPNAPLNIAFIYVQGRRLFEFSAPASSVEEHFIHSLIQNIMPSHPSFIPCTFRTPLSSRSYNSSNDNFDSFDNNRTKTSMSSVHAGYGSLPDTAFQALKELLAREDPAIVGIVLTGSAARGMATEYSDVDVIVVRDEGENAREVARSSAVGMSNQ
jgi:hypothetical protein